MGIEYQPQEKKKKKAFFIINFLKLSSNSESSLIKLKLLTSNFCDITESCKLFTSQYLGYENLFLPQVFMYLLLAFIYQWIAWHIPPPIDFSTINNTSRLPKRSNFGWVTFKAACHQFVGAVGKRVVSR